MKPDRWREVDELFAAALERAPLDRAAFLDAACASDRELRRELEKMLAFDEQAEDFIQTDVFNVAAQLITERSDEPPAKKSTSPTSFSIDDARFIPGDVLADRYRIVGLLGRGGMGEVYRADDLKLKQSVALKFLPESLTANGAALARFYREVSVARQISHCCFGHSSFGWSISRSSRLSGGAGRGESFRGVECWPAAFAIHSSAATY